MISAMKRYVTLVVLGWLLAAAVSLAPPTKAMPLGQVVSTIRDASGYYSFGAASLGGADCSGLVSVAQSLAMGQPPHRLGDTKSLLAGRWPGAIRGAAPDDLFIIGVNSKHMVAQVNGVGIEASSSGQPFRIGTDAASPWEPRFTQYHIDPGLLIV